MEEKRIPSLLLSNLFSQVDEMMGRRSLIMLLREAGLEEYVDRLPPMNDTPSITVPEYSRLLADVCDLFGVQSARPIFTGGGRLSAAEIRRQRPAQFVLTGTALRFLPAATRMRLVLERLVEQGEDLVGTPHHFYEEDDAFIVEMEDCPYCAEIDRRAREEGTVIGRPVCHIPAAIVEEMMEWATGQKRLVEETACIALGDRACRFRIAK
jgi:hypothetical protein